jgi:hypothetical protein
VGGGVVWETPRIYSRKQIRFSLRNLWPCVAILESYSKHRYFGWVWTGSFIRPLYLLGFVTVSEERFSCGISTMATPIDYCFEISASDHIKTSYR